MGKVKVAINRVLQLIGLRIISDEAYLKLKSKTTYSQYGEDSIILTYLTLNGIEKANYLDIGANHPFELNNTALLYEKGFRGVNIEPEPTMFRKLEKYRVNDINLNFGINSTEGELTYYQFKDSVLNTFSKAEATSISSKGFEMIGEKKVRVDTYNNIVNKYLHGIAPTILFLDAEGMDEIIIDSIDFGKFAPNILCVETFAYGMNFKNQTLIDKIKNFGYRIYADTYVNTIYVKN